jgi:HEAT repeats
MTAMLSVLLAVALLAGAQEEPAKAQASPPPPEGSVQDEEVLRGEQARARDEARRARTEARRAAAEKAREAREKSREERNRLSALYEQAMQQLYEKDWDQAVAAFSEVAEKGGRRADGALYWKAYAEAKKGQAAAALATLERLSAEWPESRWQRQARALALEIRPGEAPALAGGDDELELLVLGRQLDRDPARSIASLEKLLSASPSSRGAERALFLLSQSESPEARQLLLRIARGETSPRLQKKAIEYAGLFGSAESRRVLDAVYSGAASRDVKRAVLRSYLLSGNNAAVLAAARTEKDPALRSEAIRQLGVMGAHRELADLVGTETSVEAKKTALQALSLTGDSETLVSIARTEKDAALRAEAARALGLMSREKTGPALVAICRESSDPAVRRAALQGLFLQQNDEALVEVARAEKDPAVRREVVRYLSLLGSALSRELLSEILDK